MSTVPKRKAQLRRTAARISVSPALKSAKLFEGIATEGIRTALQRAEMIDCPARYGIYAQGDDPREFFLLESGRVRLSQVTDRGDEVLVRFVSPGEVFGYFGLAVGGGNIVSAQMARAGRLIVWERETARGLLAQVPKLALNLFSITVSHLIYFQEKARRMATDPVDRRVASAVLELAETLGWSESDHRIVVSDVTQRDLAEMAGTTVYTVSRALARLSASGILKAHPRFGFVIFDMNQLRSSAEPGT